MTRSLFQVQWGFFVEKKGDTPSLFEQVHGNTIVTLDLDSKTQPSLTLPKADGAISFTPQSSVYVFTADCFPVLLFTEDPKGPIAAIHAGWRGLKSGIVGKGLTLFQNYSAVHAVVGPAIGVCCFTVREDFISDWENANLQPDRFLSKKNTLLHFDLLKFLLQSELKSLSPDNIHLEAFRCTSCSQPELPSFRRNKSANPRLRSWITKLT